MCAKFNPGFAMYAHGSEQLKMLGEIIKSLHRIEDEMHFTNSLMCHYYDFAWDPDIAIDGPDKSELVKIAEHDSELFETLNAYLAELVRGASDYNNAVRNREDEWDDIHVDAVSRVSQMVDVAKTVLEDHRIDSIETEHMKKTLNVWNYILSCLKVVEDIVIYGEENHEQKKRAK